MNSTIRPSMRPGPAPLCPQSTSVIKGTFTRAVMSATPSSKKTAFAMATARLRNICSSISGAVAPSYPHDEAKEEDRRAEVERRRLPGGPRTRIGQG